MQETQIFIVQEIFGGEEFYIVSFIYMIPVQ